MKKNFLCDMDKLYNLKYERILLHELIFNEEKQQIIKYCYPAIFYEGEYNPKSYNRLIFNQIKALSGKIDLISVHHRIVQTKNEELIREFADFVSDEDIVRAQGQYDTYSLLKILKELLFRRLTIERAERIISLARQEGVDTLIKDTYIEASKIITLDRKLLKSESRSPQQLAKLVSEKINSKKDIVYTGTTFINDRFGGLTRKSVSGILARPKHLKSTFGDALISNCVQHTHNRGLIISLEDPAEERVKRIIASRLDISLRAMRFKEVEVSESDIAGVLCGTLDNRLFVVDVRDILTPEDAATCISDIKPDLVLIDHVQKFQLDDMVIGIIKAIKTIEVAAIRSNSHICITSQVSDKKVQGRDNKAPEASDAQWTSALYQSASEMMGLYYRYQDEKNVYIQNLLEVHILASRYSDAIGQLTLEINPDKAYIGEVVR